MGVKSLWSLLEPVGRPVPLETMEGRVMAIDSSIWIYQFQATMRDKEGRGLVNAHVVGVMRRICKLLFYGIKPVFVFDGGAPALKRATIAERKNKKSGAAASHAKVAERLLAAQMRREAVKQVQGHSSGTSKGNKTSDGPVTIDEDTVYLEDLMNPSKTKTPVRKSTGHPQESPPSSSKKAKWRDHDPYSLPDINMEDAIAKATRSVAPDSRLATEDELRAFIDEMRPEDFDVSSEAFRELPTEVQYEIIGDLRLKSRQTSYKRLQKMLRVAKTPMDFSREQIKNLKQRNALTQQLLTTTDSIGKAHVEIPIRIASERNKQYILVKNEGEEGGWILGVRDEGTQHKPILIDQDQPPKPTPVDDDESDMEMEEVSIPAPVPVDPDLREYRREQALTALANRYSPSKSARPKPKLMRKPRSKPLFAYDPDDPNAPPLEEEDEDPELSLAIQESLDLEEQKNLEMALEASRVSAPLRSHITSSTASSSNIGASTSRSTFESTIIGTPGHGPLTHDPLDHGSDDEDLYASPTRLETALAIAGASPVKPLSTTRATASFSSSLFGKPSLLLNPETEVPKVSKPMVVVSDSESELEEVIPEVTRPSTPPRPLSTPRKAPPIPFSAENGSRSQIPSTAVLEDSDDDSEELAYLPTLPPVEVVRSPSPPLALAPVEEEDSDADMEDITPLETAVTQEIDVPLISEKPPSVVPAFSSPPLPAPQEEPNDSSDEDLIEWSRSPSPAGGAGDTKVAKDDDHHEDWDAAHEMDPQAEEGEYVRFISQVKGKDLETVRREIDEEIRVLNQQRKAAMRDSEDITQQMISQIMMMLRLFGIPYITAPMEAEAQCAELLSLGLVDGIITDDSDVFLFGGTRVFKNMFNQSKTVECFLSTDLERELGLDRDKLVRLAYLLGSDYTEGLPGVGPVVAMELLTEFVGVEGLHRFKDWWRKVQSGRDTNKDTQSGFRKRFKKRFKELYVQEEWPNPAVRDAYYHPTVDSSEEPFKWGLPDLDALRDFFRTELGWQEDKTDDSLLPIIRKMNQRSQQGTATKQGNLNAFFDVPLGGGAVPKKRQVYGSKRLQQVVADFRKQKKAESSATSAANTVTSDSSSSSENEGESGGAGGSGRATKRRRKIGNENGGGVVGSSSAGRGRGAERGAKRGRGRGRGGRGGIGSRGKRMTKGKGRAASSSDEVEDEPSVTTSAEGTPALAVSLRPRPKPAYKGKAALESETTEEVS